jgi:hypothetical protein
VGHYVLHFEDQANIGCAGIAVFGAGEEAESAMRRAFAMRLVRRALSFANIVAIASDAPETGD